MDRMQPISDILAIRASNNGHLRLIILPDFGELLDTIFFLQHEMHLQKLKKCNHCSLFLSPFVASSNFSVVTSLQLFNYDYRM